MPLSLPLPLPRSFRYGVQLERGTYGGRPADYAYLLLCLAAILLASTALMPAPLLSGSLIMSLVYVWSRANQTVNVSFFGLFSVAGFYLPFALLGWTLVSGGDPVPDVRGIAAGHLYYFLATVWPLAGGPNLLTTPVIVKQAVQWAFGCAPRAAKCDACVLCVVHWAALGSGGGASDARARAAGGMGT